MTMHPETNPGGGNSYVNDPESGAEMARLLDQDRTLTACMGGLLPELSDIEQSAVDEVLDIGCGPGGWVQEMAFAYPQMHVTGIDISQAMVEYAQAQARIQHLGNAHFEVMDARQPLAFPDASFDLINARTIAGFMLTNAWPELLRECHRLLRPGGILRLTETDSWGKTNSLAFETLIDLSYKAAWLTGHCFDPSGHTFGVTPMLTYLLKQAGIQDVSERAYAINFSVGARVYKAMYENVRVFFQLMQPFVLKARGAFPDAGIPDKEELDRLYNQMQIEMLEDDFVGIFYLLTAWGVKRDPSPPNL